MIGVKASAFGIVKHQTACRIGSNISPAPHNAGDLFFTQERSGLILHQQAGVAPAAQKICVIGLPRDQDLCQTHRQRPIPPRQDAQPMIRPLRIARSARINRQDLGPARPCCGDLRCLIQPDRTGVKPPQQDRIGVLIIGVKNARPIGELMRVVLVPVADFRGIDGVWTAKQPDEPLHPFDRVTHWRAARRGHAKANGLCPVACFDRLQPLRDILKRLLPRHPLPARIGIGFRGGATLRIKQAIRVAPNLRRGLSFQAERLSRRVIRGGFCRDQLIPAHLKAGPAARPAQTAKAVDFTCCGCWHIMSSTPQSVAGAWQ